MMLNLTAYSQITGIPKETKQEIVSTLEAYPIALQEIEILLQVNKELIELTKESENKISIYKEIFKSQQEEIENLIQQKKEYKKKLEKKSSYGFIYGQVNLNGFNSYTVGVDYIFKERLIIGGNVSYDDLYNNINTNLKIGFKAF